MVTVSSRRTSLSAIPSLTTLPAELLTKIALSLDRPSALSLALASRAFTFSADNRIWRDPDLCLHPHFGELPLSQPYDRYDARHSPWATGEAKNAEDRRRAGLKDKVRQITMEGSVKRFGMVERVTIVPRPEALHAIIALLEMVGPNLKDLEVQATAPHFFAHTWRPGNYDTLDVKVLDYHLQFPSLDTIRMNTDSIRFPEFILLLCASAPNVTTVDVDIQHPLETPQWDGTVIPKYPGRYGELGLTKIRKLRLAFIDRTDAGTTVANPVAKLIYLSPLLEQVSVDFGPSNKALGRIVRSLSKCTQLHDLRISLSPADFCQRTDAMLTDCFTRLRRLVLRSDSDLAFFRHLPFFETLEILHIEHPYAVRSAPAAASVYPECVTSTTVFPDFCTRLWRNSRIRIINSVPTLSSIGDMDEFRQLDEIETGGKITGTVRSLRHGQGELLHARIYLRCLEKSDTLAVRDFFPGDTRHRIPYLARNGSKGEKTYEALIQEDYWVDLIEYDGYAVPMEILLRMRRKEGASLADWDGRGVQVGAGAWKVLTDWRGPGSAVTPVREGRLMPMADED